MKYLIFPLTDDQFMIKVMKLAKVTTCKSATCPNWPPSFRTINNQYIYTWSNVWPVLAAQL